MELEEKTKEKEGFDINAKTFESGFAHGLLVDHYINEAIDWGVWVSDFRSNERREILKTAVQNLKGLAERVRAMSKLHPKFSHELTNIASCIEEYKEIQRQKDLITIRHIGRRIVDCLILNRERMFDFVKNKIRNESLD